MGLARDRDVISGSLIAALGVFVLTTALQWNYIGPDGPGPGFFPVWYGVLMIALSLYLVVKAAIKPDPEARSAIDWSGTGRALGTWAAFALSIAVMEPLGFYVSFGLLTLFMVTLVMGKPVVTALLTAIVMSASFGGVFSYLLSLNLPVGTLWAPILRLAGMGA
jgi:putative tricarboxylic transport membrane protein